MNFSRYYRVPSDQGNQGNQGKIREFGSGVEKSGKNQGKEAFFKESGKIKKIRKKNQGNQGKIGFLFGFLTLE